MATIVPALQPRPPQQGVLAVLPTLPGGFPDRDSIEFAPELCSGFGGIEAVDCPTDINLTDDPENPSLVTDPVWWVYEIDQCSTAAMDGAGRRDFQGRAQRALLATQSYRIAQALWDSDINPYPIAAPAAVELGNAALTMPAAIAALDGAMAECGKGRLGLIHMSAQALSLAAETTQLRFAGGIYVTPMGNRIVADAGYPGTGPAGEAIGTTQWIYGTSDMAYALSPVESTPDSLEAAVDKRSNLVRVMASRFVVVQWDQCCHFAVKVNAPTPTPEA